MGLKLTEVISIAPEKVQCVSWNDPVAVSTIQPNSRNMLQQNNFAGTRHHAHKIKQVTPVMTP